MAKVLVRARVQRNGMLAISKRVRRELNLQIGDVLEFESETNEIRDLDPARNPLLQLCGMGKGGRVDGAENHDKYLYKNGGE